MAPSAEASSSIAVPEQHATKVTLAGKVIAVTGTNRGIGLGVAKSCLDNGAAVMSNNNEDF
ncbi:unnamed protein product [Clonostachys byssicola]|uniref:Uncharacterized protein n=1 Tax=Clonostachys byssicola TaxID=160290 RepID=A0A9N9U910_9HYPO|nr:unnamed protein product [Clonostachys byssicola]